MTEPLVRPNDIVAGKYRIERMLGEGGMGVVVAAQHLELDRLVAIKFLLPQIAEQSQAAERFRREAKAAARIKSEHVCRVLDVGSLESGVPYMVMEYLEGRDLAWEVSSRGRLPASEAIDYVLQACEAVAEAHAAGIVHRDLKPENLFLAQRPDGTRGVKVLDFGVSKSLLVGAGQLKLTRTATIVGSPLYMSPEQLDSAKDVDVRADIWALGTILYELMTGRTPFAAESIPQLVAAVLNGSPPPFETLGVMARAGLEPAVLRALEKDRTARYGTIADFARGIAPFAPAHAALSVLRIERVLAMKDSDPARSLNGPVESRENQREERASVTMNVVDGPGTIRSETPQAWGNTAAPPRRPRRRFIAIATAFPLVMLLAFVLRSRTPVGRIHAEPNPGIARAVLVETPTVSEQRPFAPPSTVVAETAAPARPPLPVVAEPPVVAPPPKADAPIVTPATVKVAPAHASATDGAPPSHPTPRVRATAAPAASALPAMSWASPFPVSAKPESPLDGTSAFGGRK